MAGVKIDRFGGILPRVHPSLLADGMATRAHNCRLENGKVRPLRQPTLVEDALTSFENGLSDIADAKTIYPWKTRTREGGTELTFLAFPGDVDIANGNVANDDRARLFVTGDTGVTWRNPSTGATYSNVPCVYMRSGGDVMRHPLTKATFSAPKCANQNQSLNRGAIKYTRFFQTWVDPYGYESAVSDASLTWLPNAGGAGIGAYSDRDLEYNDGDVITISEIPASEIPEGSVDENGDFIPGCGFKRRIYKVVTGSEEGNIQFVREISDNPWGVVELVVRDDDAGELLQEVTSPPVDLRGIVYVPGSFYAGFSASAPQTVMFSETDLPHSWPVAYQYDIRDNIVGLAVTSNSVFVLSDGHPWVFHGTSPDSMVASVLAGPAACVSKRSICVYKNAVFFASNQGICTIYNDADAGTVVTNLTEGAFTKEQWQALNPASCLMRQYDGALHCFFATESGRKYGLVISMSGGSNAISTHDEVASCLCVDNETDMLYFVRNV